MRALCTTAILTLWLLIPGTTRADGLVYQLPEDRTWVRFDVLVKSELPGGREDSVAHLMEIVTISSVGTAEVDGQRCRWIEIAQDAKDDERSYTQVVKLLIPENFLGKGQEPLKHVLKAWRKHPLFLDGVPEDITKELKDLGAQSVNPRMYRTQLILHGPFEAPKKLDKVTVDSKLGKLECEGVSGQDQTKFKELKITHDSTYTIRLHQDAPFGVAAWEAKRNVERDGKFEGTLTETMNLSDFGKNAKSAIPDAK